MKGETTENPCTCYTDMCQFVTNGKSFKIWHSSAERGKYGYFKRAD